MARSTNLTAFKAWSKTAKPGELYVYHDPAVHERKSPAAFSYARELDADGSFFVYQDRSPVPGDFYYVALKIGDRAARFLKAAAASVPGPTVLGRDVR